MRGYHAARTTRMARTTSPTTDRDSPPQRDTMRYWLLRKLRELQDANDLNQKDVAFYAGVDAGQISRFINQGTWPRALDQIVAAYALLSGIEDPRDIWIEAAENFRRHGTIPSADDAGLTPPALAARRALEAAQRHRRPYTGESRGKPTSSRRKRAAG